MADNITGTDFSGNSVTLATKDIGSVHWGKQIICAPDGTPISAGANNAAGPDYALTVRPNPQRFVDCSFALVGSGLQNTDYMTQIGSTGAGMTVSQSAGNLVIAAGTTANSETILRSNQTFNGAMILKAAVTLSQRNANNNFYVELVDVIGDGLAYSIVNATTVDVTKVAHGFTAVNVGQRMDIGAITGAAGIPMEAVIASIPGADTIRFTVAGWPATGSGTCSLWGWNKIELNYTGATATVVSFNTRRKGWQNTAANAPINTTASGHIVSTSIANGIVSIGDQTLAAGNAYVARSAWPSNIPLPDVPMYIQIRAKNGTAAPTATTWTVGFWRVEDYVQNRVEIGSVSPQSVQNYFPVSVPTPVSITHGSALAAGTNIIGAAVLAMPQTVADVASAALTTTTTTAAFTPAYGSSYEINIPVTVVSGTNPTLDVVVQESDDAGTNWYDVYHFPRITATGIYRSPRLPINGNRVRYVQTVTGTTPSFTRAINRLQCSDIPTPIRQLIDRTLAASQALNAVTGSLNVQNCRNAQLVIRSGAITTTAPAIQLEGSDDNGGSWYAVGSPLTAVANSTVQLTVNNIQSGLLRGRVSTAGSGATLDHVLIKGF